MGVNETIMKNSHFANSPTRAVFNSAPRDVKGGGGGGGGGGSFLNLPISIKVRPKLRCLQASATWEATRLRQPFALILYGTIFLRSDNFFYPNTL